MPRWTGTWFPMSAKIYGEIAAVLVDDNQPVKAGQVLVRIDSRDYQARADQAKAALALAESQAQAAQVGVPLSQDTTRSYTSSADAQFGWSQADDRARQFRKDSTAELAMAAQRRPRQADNDRAQADLARYEAPGAEAGIFQLQFDAYQAAARV